MTARHARDHRRPQRRHGLWLGVLAVVLASCGGGEAGEAKRAPLELPEGNLLPEAVESYVFGGSQGCRADADCESGICYYGVCGGLLNVDTRWMQEVIADTLVEISEEDPRLRERIVWNLARISVRPRTDLAFRVRCVVGLERFDAKPELRQILTHDELPEAAHGAASLALSRLGDPAGVPMTVALTEADSVPTAAEALRALGASHLTEGVDVLVGLLRTLNPDLDSDLVHAAIDALGELGDPRAIGPLVAFLDRAPDFLEIRVTRALRRLTGARLGEDAAAWRTWLAGHPQPQTPPYTLRVYDTAQDIGLPPP
ncbi:MAG: HEAT repeat domain-containing protein [Deltaproteobacteria bacterium]|nr:MAG: HEAT repeat domain-containing protein [Deltaproteobacteria bacterium]